MDTTLDDKEALLHALMDMVDKSKKSPPLKSELQSSKAAPSPQLMFCPPLDASSIHPLLLGRAPLNTCDLIDLYDNTESGIFPTQVDIT